MASISGTEGKAETIFPQWALLAGIGACAGTLTATLGHLLQDSAPWGPLPWYTIPVGAFTGGLIAAVMGGLHIQGRIELQQDREHELEQDKLDIERRRQWAEERKLGMDLDGDGHVGQPPKAAYRAANGQIVYEDAPTPEQRKAWLEFVTDAWTHGATSREHWRGMGLEDGLWELFTDRLITAGMARRADDRKNSRLVKLATLEQVLSAFAEFG